MKTSPELDKVRSSCMYENEVLKVIYTGNAVNIPRGVEIPVESWGKKHTLLPYPQPKWIACRYYFYDLDGDKYIVGEDRYGELRPGFEWVRNDYM